MSQIPDEWSFQSGVIGPGSQAIVTIPAPVTGSRLRLIVTHVRAVWTNNQQAAPAAANVTVNDTNTDIYIEQLITTGAGASIITESELDVDVSLIGLVETAVLVKFGGIAPAGYTQQLFTRGYVQ